MTVNPISSGKAPSPVDTVAYRPSAATTKAHGRPERLAPATDTVALSSMSATVRDLATAPPIDTGKVAALKAAIATGTYKVDPSAIADEMIALDLP